MSSPSAASWKPRRPDTPYGNRALVVMQSLMKQVGALGDVQDAMLRAPAGVVELPGFSLFDRGARSPYEWCVPRPEDSAALLNVYEEYVDRPLGAIRRPDLVARSLFSRSTAGPFFGPARPSTHWRVPAAKLIAMAQHFGAVVEARGDAVRTELEGYRLAVSGTWAFSNLRRGEVHAARAAKDVTGLELTALPLLSEHPLAHAVTKLVSDGVDCSALWMANTALRAERGGLISKITPASFVPRAPAIGGPREAKPKAPEEVHAATLEAQEIALHMTHEVLRAMYEAAVPRLCSARRFKRAFGDPWSRPDREPRAETRADWVTRLELLSNEALNANA